MRFFEKKLYQIEVFYDENRYPEEIRNFAEIISGQINVPIAEWQISNKKALLKCGEISLAADYQINPRIELTNETVLARVAEIQKKDEEKPKS